MIQSEGRRVYCDCGCRQTMAFEYDDRFVIKATHHGREHLMTISKMQLHEGYRDMLQMMVHGSTN